MELAHAADEVETISRTYARIHGIERTDDWLLLKLQEEVGELTQAYLRSTGRARSAPDDDGAAVRDELADVLAHLLLLARRLDVDLDAALEAKWFRWRHLVEDADRA